MKDKIKVLSSDLENGQLTEPSWLWIGVGGLLGFMASCMKFKRNNTKPILARFDKVKENTEEQE